MDTDIGGVSLHLLTYKLYSNIYNHVGFVLFCFGFCFGFCFFGFESCADKITQGFKGKSLYFEIR